MSKSGYSSQQTTGCSRALEPTLDVATQIPWEPKCNWRDFTVSLVSKNKFVTANGLLGDRWFGFEIAQETP